ncbi:MAG TPA: hypothetical protein VLF93_00300 [Candidatus Saccharimonadales bacterium]|nr:hypothetical protein [Candidatus Saccharimonadales bacterium]
MKIHYILATLLFFAIVSPVQTHADGGCLTVNNGGITTKQVCPSPTPSQQQQQPSQSTNSDQNQQQPKSDQQHASGQQVYPPSQTKSTPDTGPEDWSLPALLLLAGTGFFLINKSRPTSEAKT